MFITDSLFEYKHSRKKKAVREGRFKTEIHSYNYINQYYPKENLIKEQRKYDNGKTKVATWNNDIEWVITDETKEILGYTVRKATTSSFEITPDSNEYYGKTIAWFTEEILIPAGPARYYGLPGLILELGYEGTSQKYVAKDIKFQNPNYKISDISKGKKVDSKYDVIYFW